MVKRVVFFKGKLETLDYFCDRIIDAAIKIRLEVLVLDTRSIGSISNEEIVQFVSKEDTIAYFFNQIGIHFTIAGENVWEKYDVPVYTHMVDHPINYHDVLDNPIDNLHIINLDLDHSDYIHKYCPKIKDVLFLPNGGNMVVEGNILPYYKRSIDVLYVGSCQEKITTIPSCDLLPNNGIQLFETVCNILRENPNLTIEQTIELYLDAISYNKNDIERLKIIQIYWNYVQAYIRRYFKQRAMHLLGDAGINVEVYGDNWEDEENPMPGCIHIHNRVSSDQCNKLLADAKIGLNFMPWFKRGSSERVFNVMTNGAVCVTDVSEYLLNNYEQGKDIVYYNLGHEEDLVVNIQWLLNNPQRAEEIAHRGRILAQKQDTWEARFTNFIDGL